MEGFGKAKSFGESVDPATVELLNVHHAPEPHALATHALGAVVSSLALNCPLMEPFDEAQGISAGFVVVAFFLTTEKTANSAREDAPVPDEPFYCVNSGAFPVEVTLKNSLCRPCLTPMTR